MADYLPPEFAQQFEALKRRQALAQAMQAQAMQQRPTEVITGHAVRQGPLSHGLRAISGILANRNLSQADEGLAGIRRQASEATQAEMGSVQGDLAKALMSQNPQVKQYAMQMAELQKQQAQTEQARAMAEKAAREDAPKPFNVPEGAAVFDPTQGKEVYRNPNDPRTQAGRMSPLGQLMAERDQLPEGDPRRQAYDMAIRKANTHAPAASTNVSYGGQFAAETPEGLPVLAQPSKAGGAQIIQGLVPAGTRAAQGEREISANKGEQAIGLIDKALNHPGLPRTVGLAAQLNPLQMVGGTPEYDFNVLTKQIEGKAFLEAFETLKGGGQITETEGKKATEAIARLSRAQSEAEYRKALGELRDVAATGVKRARQKPGQQAPAEAPKRLRFDANGNMLP